VRIGINTVGTGVDGDEHCGDRWGWGLTLRGQVGMGMNTVGTGEDGDEHCGDRWG